jgi:hypothetical protein
MKTYHFLTSRHIIFIICSILLLALPIVMSAQDSTPQGTPIQITGMVNQINGKILSVAGFSVDVSNVGLDTRIAVGVSVTVTGHLLPGNIIVAQSVIMVIINPPSETTPEPGATLTPEATVTPSPNGNPVIVIEGPVVNIVNNIITVYNFNIKVAPNHPILNIIQVGDVVHIEGIPNSNGVIVASVVSNIVTTTTVSTGSPAPTVSLDGPVDSINGNIVTVNGIPVQFATNDPILQNLQVGNFVSVQGDFSGSGNTIILIVINVTIFNNITIINNNCWFDPGPDDGMGMGMEDPAMGMEDPAMGMGHWHCDGMGMGEPGMGDPAMGMGGS